MGAVRLVLRQDFTRVVCAKRNRWKMMMLSVVLSIGLLVNKMILKYQSGRKHELTNDMMKRVKGEGNCEISKSKPDDFLREV